MVNFSIYLNRRIFIMCVISSFEENGCLASHLAILSGCGYSCSLDFLLGIRDRLRSIKVVLIEFQFEFHPEFPFIVILFAFS